MSSVWRKLLARLAPPPIEIDPRVPPLARWGPRGIVGVIGLGPHAGEPVFAMRESRHDGTYISYCLDLPDDLLDLDGKPLVNAGNFDLRVRGAEGGIIDRLTRALDVSWRTDEASIDAYLQDEH